MLFHVTATHSVDNCPGYNQDKFPQLIEAASGMEQTAKDLGVKVHFVLNGLPEHVVFSLLEADSPAAVARLLVSAPIKQDFKMTAVVHDHEVIEMAKAMMAQG